MTEPVLDELLLPGFGDVARYREHGWWISPIILSSGVLDAAKRSMNECAVDRAVDRAAGRRSVEERL